MTAKLIAGAALCALILASWHQLIAPPTPRLIYNESESAPLGWYALDPKGEVKRDALVAAFAPGDMRGLADARGYLPAHVPLIKTVWAIGGERVCHDGEWVSVLNRPDVAVLRQDGSGRDLPVTSGCYTLHADEVFLISTDVQTSWDSRYFGPVRKADVMGTVRWLGKRGEP